MNGSRIRLDVEVEEQMLMRRVRSNGFLYKPAPADELAHLLAHCVFEYNGYFDDYYSHRCAELADEVQDESGQGLDGQFRELLDSMFYKAGTLVYENVCRREFQGLRRALRAFADY